MIALLSLAVACNKEIVKPVPDASGITTIQAVIPELDDIRAYLDGTSYKQFWSEGDEISVFDGVANIKFTLTAGAGTPTATFSTDGQSGLGQRGISLRNLT